MKTHSSLTTAALILSLTFFGHGAFAAKPKKATPAKADVLADVYKVDAAASSLKWDASKLAGTHNGDVKIKDGQVVVTGGKITGGSFSIDMTSIVNHDIANPEYNAKLIGHLKSEDFFSVEKNPTASFELKSATPLAAAGSAGETHTLVGTLTIKKISNEIQFPAKITIADGKAHAIGKITIDRTKWDIRYRSLRFFSDIGDKVIKDEINFNLDILASK